MITIESAGIYNSQISYKNIKKTRTRCTSLFELELPLENGGISYINKTAMPISKNTFICAKPGQTRCTQFPFKCYYVHLSVQDEYLYKTLTEMPNFMNIANHNEYKEIFTDLCKYYDTYIKRDEIMTTSLVLKLIYSLGSEAGEYAHRQNYVSNSCVNKAIKYINENIENDLSLKQVSAYVSLTPTYFHSCFKQAVGKTLREYVESARIKHSVNLMLTTDMTLTDISYRSGFSSQSYYSSVFKRKLGLAPRKYLKFLNDKYNI